MRPRILFYVQHLLGIGHIKRASLLVRGWVDAGLEVTVVSGGEPVAQFGFGEAQLIQLPPVKARDSSFSGLVDGQGQALDNAFKTRRTQQLLDALEATQPQLVVIENYPFGRRQLRWELLPLLQHAQQLASSPLILCSVRDILQQRSPQRTDETLGLLDAYFDAILVHGDAGFIPLEDSFPRANTFAEKLHYTGYVTEIASEQPLPVVFDSAEAIVEPAEVVVSAGGGAVGFTLMGCCLQLLRRPELVQRLALGNRLEIEKGREHPQQHTSTITRWRFLLGPNLSGAERQQLENLAAQSDSSVEVVLEPLRTDFSALLQRCQVSISQGGYNTLMDLLAAGCAAVVVPFEGSGETEQRCRTERLAQLGYCQMLAEADLTPENLLQALNASQASATSELDVKPLRLDFNGAVHSAQILKRLLHAHA